MFECFFLFLPLSCCTHAGLLHIIVARPSLSFLSHLHFVDHSLGGIKEEFSRVSGRRKEEGKSYFKQLKLLSERDFLHVREEDGDYIKSDGKRIGEELS